MYCGNNLEVFVTRALNPQEVGRYVPVVKRALPKRRLDSGGTMEEMYAYYADGAMSQKTDRNGIISQYVYDIHSRLITEIVGDDEVSYTYDYNGNQLTMTDSTGTTTRTYDSLNRVLTKTVPVIGTTTFANDITSGLLSGYVGSSTTDPKGHVVTRLNDKAGRLYQVKEDSTITATYSYYDNGNLQKLQYSGSSEEYTYYDNNRLHTLSNKIGSTIIEANSYNYDAVGNQTSKRDSKGTTTYTYDELNRLEQLLSPVEKQPAIPMMLPKTEQRKQ